MHAHSLQLLWLPLNVPHRMQGDACDGHYEDHLDVLDGEIKTAYFLFKGNIDNAEQIDYQEEQISRDFDRSHDAFTSFDPVKDAFRVSHESWLEENGAAHVMHRKLPV